MTKVTAKALERAVADISKVSMITDYQGNVVPQYFDTALLQYVPITNSWGGTGGGGGTPPDLTEIEEKLRYMEQYGNKAYRVQIGDNVTPIIDISKDLGIQIVKKDIIIYRDGVEEPNDGYAFNVINLQDNKKYDLNLSLSINTASNGDRSTWYQWLYGTLEESEVLPILYDHGALFFARERVSTTITNETTRCIFNIIMMGVTNPDGNNYVDMIVTRAEMKTS